MILALTKLKNRTFILLHILYISTIFLPTLYHYVVSYMALKTLLNEVHTYIFLHYTVGGICWRL